MADLAMLPDLLAQAPAREVQEFVTELRFVPQGWWLVGYLGLWVGIVWLVFWMYQREGRVGASRKTRLILATARSLVFLILAVIFLGPVRVRILRRWVDSYTLLLVDTSSSMDLSDAYSEEEEAKRVRSILGTDEQRQQGRIRRGDLVEALFARDDRAFLKGLIANNRVKLYTFGDKPELLGTFRRQEEQPSSAEVQKAGQDREQDQHRGQEFGQEQKQGQEQDPVRAQQPGDVRQAPTHFVMNRPMTNIEQAIRRTTESLGNAPIAAAVVISDGGFNRGGSAQDVARFALDRRLPIHVIGVGDPASPRNVRIVEVVAPTNVFQQDPFVITARLTAEGLDGQSIRVDLKEFKTGGSGEGRIVRSKGAVVKPGGTVDEMMFHQRHDEPGRFVYTVEVPLVEDESLADDNAKQTTVNVIDSRTRVLLVAGGPGWDYQFLITLLMRDDSFDLSCWLQSADVSAVRDGNTVIDHLPRTPEELFEYDVIILMDPDRAELDEPWCRLLDDFVTEYGGGLIFQAGRRFTPTLMREPSLKPLRDLLPVALDPEADLVLNRIGHYQLSSAPVEIPESSIGHPVVLLTDDPVTNKFAWQGIGDIYWHYPVLREKPAATVLMRHSDPRMRNSFGGHVLTAVQFSGAGRTAFMGFDGTFRWRIYGEALFNRFWIQLIRHVGEGKLLAGMDRGMILTDADQFPLGEAVALTARLYNVRYEPLQADEVTAQWLSETFRGEVMLKARSEQPGWFEGQFLPDRIGSFQIRIQLDGPVGEGPAEITKEIRVARPNLEIVKPQADRKALQILAEQSAGGRYFNIDEALALPGIIPDLHEEIPIRSRPTSLWDNAYVFGLLIGLLSVEWAVRKWRHLL